MICSGGCLGLFGVSDLGGFSGNGFVEEGFVDLVLFIPVHFLHKPNLELLLLMFRFGVSLLVLCLKYILSNRFCNLFMVPSQFDLDFNVDLFFKFG